MGSTAQSGLIACRSRVSNCCRGLDILIGILTDPSRDPVQLREAAGACRQLPRTSPAQPGMSYLRRSIPSPGLLLGTALSALGSCKSSAQGAVQREAHRVLQ